MILADLEKKITSKVINKVWKEQFNSEMSFKGLTLSSAKRLYENLCSDINDIRHKNYLVSEKNAKYLSMLATARFLTEYIHEKTYLTEVTMGITAKQAIDRSKLAREQANLALEIAIRNIAELYLLNIGRQWARRHPNNTLEIDFSMAAMGLVIDAQKITNKQLLASNFWITVEKNLEEICGKYFKFGTPRDMTIDNGYITFKNSEFRPIKPLKVHENKNSLLEVDKDYHTGVGMALGHGVNTVKNFAPHVAGSAIGAFVGGLKGQALKSEHGKIHTVVIDLDQEMKEHFSEFKDPKVRKILRDYLEFLDNAGASGKSLTIQDINKQMEELSGNPLRDVKDAAKRAKLAEYFLEIYEQGKKIKKTSTKTGSRSANTKVTNDVLSALKNQGYKQNAALAAIRSALQKNPKLQNDFDDLFRAATSIKINTI